MSSIIKVNTVQDTDGNNIINENANTITIGASGDTISIPAGATLANSGTATGFASIAWQSSIVTAATHTASAGQGLWLDTSSNAITLTLPASPSVGDQIIFTDYARNWETNAVTLNLNSEKFQGNTTPVPVYDTTGESVDIVYSGSTKGWIPNTDGAVALETPQDYSAEYLVVAGGSGGGHGGGGAGGYRTNYGGSAITLSGGNVYTVTVGAAGAAGAFYVDGGTGGNSSLSGSGITTITSAGGGIGGTFSQPGANGGCGGGGGGRDNGGNQNNGGSGNTPSTTPSQGFYGCYVYFSSTFGGVGGGGAGANGGNGAAATGGAGGDGNSNSITGSGVYYAGGGGGGANGGGATSGGDGGNGGGGHGSPSPTDGTDNLGGGGGGGYYSGGGQPAKAGGSGVVILRVPTVSYSGTVTGSPTVTTDGSHKVIKFTGSGSYTA